MARGVMTSRALSIPWPMMAVAFWNAGMSQDDVHELISALLDGELAPDEQARVEDLLLDSAEHRQTFREMRALRDQIQSLPTHTARPDFCDSILRQIVQRGLTPERVTEVNEDSEPGSHETKKIVPSRHDTNDSPRGVKRGLTWAALAIAASLLIVFIYGPFNQPPEREAADGRVSSSNDQPSEDASNGNSELKDLDGEETAASKLDAKQPAVGLEGGLKRHADTADKAAPARLRRFASADASYSGEDLQAIKELVDQRLVVEEAKLGQRRLLRGGLGGGGGDYTGKVELCYVVDVPMEAMASGIVDDALRENGIAIIDARGRRGAAHQDLAVDHVDILTERVSRDPSRDSAEDEVFQSGKEGRLAKSLDELSDAEVLVVNATPKQIEATLASLQKSGLQWKLHRGLKDEAELPSKGNGQASGATQLESSQLATRSAGLKDAPSTDESDDAQPGSSSASQRSEARDDIAKSRKHPLPSKAPSEGNAEAGFAGRPQQKKKAVGSNVHPTVNGRPIDKAIDSKNEIGKPIGADRERAARGSFSKSLENKPSNGNQVTPQVYAYRVKPFARQDSGKAVANEMQEESPTTPLPSGVTTSVVPGKDRVNNAKPKRDNVDNGKAEPTAAGSGLADVEAATSENSPIVRAIVVLRLVPSTQRTDVPKPAP